MLGFKPAWHPADQLVAAGRNLSEFEAASAVRARIVRFIVYKEIAPHPEVADAAAELDEAFLIQDALQRLVGLGKHQREILDAAGMQSVQKPVPRQHGDTLSPADEADLRIYAVLQDVELAFALFDDNRSMV